MNKPLFAWLRVSMEVDAELAEAVADVFGRYISSGVVIESTRVDDSANDQGKASGPLRVSAYIPSDEKLERTRTQVENGLRALSLIQPIPQARYVPIAESNWMESWKEHFQPLEVGKTLIVIPAWVDIDSGERLPIRIDPGMAFGTGVHPTTQLSMQMLEDHLKDGNSLIDVGCGSGILSIVAAKLGASPILGMDIDPIAVENSQQHAALNKISAEFGLGSVSEIRNGQFSVKQADIVVANILAPVLIRLLNEGLGELLAPKGILLLSGLLEEQLEALQSALRDASLQVIDERKIGDWRAIVANK
jgi:ribosomal protein L11 methyltransferase